MVLIIFILHESPGIKKTSQVLRKDENIEHDETHSWSKIFPGLTEDDILVVKVFDHEKIMKNK